MINLSDYTPRIRESLKRGGFACVYIASTPEDKPSRIGYATDLHQAISAVQHHCPMPVWVQDVLWVPDRSIATSIAKMTQAALAGKLLHGGWVDESADRVVDEMGIVAFKLAPGMTMVTHAQLIAQWKTERAKIIA